MNLLRLSLVTSFFLVPLLFFMFYNYNFDVVSEKQNNNLFMLYKIGNEIDLAEQYLLKNVNYSKAHVKQAQQYYDPQKFKEISPLDQRTSDNIVNEVSSLDQLANSSLPIEVKALGLSQGMTHIEDLIQVLEVALIRNDTQLPSSLKLFFSSLIDSIYNNYKNSLIWNEQPVSQANETTGMLSKNTTIQEKKFNNNTSASLPNIILYQSSQGLSNNIFEFIDFVTQLRPEILEDYNMTKIKEEFKTLNNAIGNKSDIKEVDEIVKNFDY